MLDKIKKIIHDWFHEKPLTANDAYSIARYGKIVTEDYKLNQALQSIHELIKFKSQNDDMSLIYELINAQHDYLDEKGDIIRIYKDLNFYVEEVELCGNSYLFISWKKELILKNE